MVDGLENRKWCLYIHINKINGKKYVGITSQTPTKRWGVNGSSYRKNKHFWAAIQKYGWNNFRHEILLMNETYKYACAAEKCLIKHYKSNIPQYGYNQSIGGDKASLGRRLSDETKQKLREANLGKSVPQEIRDKISRTEKGRVFPDEVKRKISNGLKGRKYSEETLKKMSEAKKGKGTTEVYCHELDIVFNSLKDAQEYTGVHYQSIGQCCRGKLKTAGSYRWSYTKDPKTRKK